MSGAANFPTSLDDNTSLHDVADGVSVLEASHHNDIKEAVKAIQAKLGIHQTSVATSIDYRLGSATAGHTHDGASGMGRPINPSTIPAPSGALGSPTYLHDHLMNATIHPVQLPRYVVHRVFPGTLVATTNFAAPMVIPRTMQLLSVAAAARVGASGATLSLDVNIGPTSIYTASALFRPIFAPGATLYGNASPNLVTYPSGAIITFDVDTVGSNHAGNDIGLTLVFRD